MTALQYMGTGIIFGGFAGVCLVGAIVFFFVTKQKKYLYAGRFRKIKFPEQFYTDMREQYKKTESISETLDALLMLYPKGKVAKRIRASKDYLKHSHYKDYETALYRYLSDSDTANVITEVLVKDLQKINPISDERITLQEYMKDAESYLEQKESNQKQSEQTITFYAAECMEFPDVGEIYENLTLEEAIQKYESIPAERINGIKGIGFDLEDGSDYEGKYALMHLGRVERENVEMIQHFKENLSIQKALDTLEKYCEKQTIYEDEKTKSDKQQDINRKQKQHNIQLGLHR